MTQSRQPSAVLRALIWALAGSGLTASGLAEPAIAQSPTTPTTPTTTTDTTTTPATTNTQPGSPTTPTTTPTATTPATTGAGAPPPVIGQKAQPLSPGAGNKHPRRAAPKHPKKAKPPKPPSLALNPTAPPAPTSITLPPAIPTVASLNYFRIPLFLLPVYQAASIDYGVPWQVLAAINEIETDYGRNQSVSSAGAVGWMQFLPSSWLQYGVDATGAGVEDPYNAADAIYAAASYLRAAGAQANLRGAIYAYNHATWYVDSVMLRAQLIGTFPDTVIAGLNGLAQGQPPIAAPTSYASVAPPAPPASRSARAGRAKPAGGTGPVDLVTRRAARVVAVQDGRVLALGHSRRRGNFIQLRDVYGNVYTYSGLTSIARRYRTPTLGALAPKTSAGAPNALAAGAASPQHPATAGKHPLAGPAAASAAPAAPAPQGRTQNSQRRVFAHPQLAAAALAADRRANPTSKSPRARPAGRRPTRWSVLAPGAVVTAGTVLGRVDPSSPGRAARLRFAINPSGDARGVDPRPIITSWRLLGSTLHAGHPKAAPSDALNPSVARVLLESKATLRRQVLADRAIKIYKCGRSDIASGAIDTRVLSVLEYLSASGLKPTVSSLKCGHSTAASRRAVASRLTGSEHATGNAVDITAINGVPILGHQGPGSIADLAINRLLMIASPFAPDQIIGLNSYPGAGNTLALPDHANRIEIAFYPRGAGGSPRRPAAATARLAAAARAAAARAAVRPLTPAQWSTLIDRLAANPNPGVLNQPSSAALRVPAPPPAAKPRRHR